MKKYRGIVLIFLVAVIIFTAGCTSRMEPVAPVQQVPASSVPTTGPSVTAPAPSVTTTPVLQLTPKVTAIPSVVSVVTSTPPSDPTDVTEIKFYHYSDIDFGVDYPSTWTINHSTYTPYYCTNDSYVYGKVYHVCYENETRLIGPLNFYVNDNVKKPLRIVTFTSPDGRLKFVSSTSDFIDNFNGYFKLNPTLDWIKNEFQSAYPDLSASTYVGNYKYFRSGNTMASTWDVRLPEGSGYYPSAYTEEAVVTVHHFYQFAFITNNENFDNYQNLKEIMISSIKTNDAA